jgi:hypothetical protein
MLLKNQQIRTINCITHVEIKYESAVLIHNFSSFKLVCASEVTELVNKHSAVVLILISLHCMRVEG